MKNNNFKPYFQEGISKIKKLKLMRIIQNKEKEKIEELEKEAKVMRLCQLSSNHSENKIIQVSSSEKNLEKDILLTSSNCRYSEKTNKYSDFIPLKKISKNSEKISKLFIQGIGSILKRLL